MLRRLRLDLPKPSRKNQAKQRLSDGLFAAVDSIDRIAKVKVPLLVVHGDSDSLIPPELGRELYERATARKRFVLVEGGTHYTTNLRGQDEYRQAVRELFGVGV